ncbi:MAG: pitrilysin family protein [Candidatus Acidiferrum sp.]
MSPRNTRTVVSIFLLLIASFGFCAGRSSAQTAAVAPAHKLPTIPYEEFTLKNGLQVILSEDHTLPLVSVNIWYHVGAANERAGRTGFAHLFEHMMFEGSQHVGAKAHFSYLEAAGATDINGTTDFDRTNYYETVPSNQLDLALWLESDRMGYLLGKLDIENLANQRDVVRNERRQSTENTPYGLVEEGLMHSLFPPDHPYYPNVIGSHADVEAAKLEDVRDFFKQYYTPNDATLVIAGDFDKSSCRAMVEKYFGTIPQGPQVPKVNVVTPPITKEVRTTVTDQVQLPRLYMGWLTPPVFKPGDVECELFAQILAGGKSSRLYKALVYDKEIAQDVSAGMEGTKLASMFELIVTAKPGVKLEDLEKAVDVELDKLRADGVTPAELNRARNVTETSLVRGLQRTNGVANRLNYYNFYAGTPNYFTQDIARYDKVTPADVNETIRTTFKNTARAVTYGIPGEKVVKDVPKTTEEENKKQATAAGPSKAAMTDEAWRATPPKPGPSPKFSLPVAKQVKLANGLSVLLVERHNLPIVSATLYTLSGSELNPLDKPGLSSFTANMLSEGTASRSSMRFSDDTDQIGATLGSEAGYSSAYLELSVLTWNAPAGFDLLSDATLHPAFDAKEIERLRSRRITAVLQEDDDAGSIAYRTADRELYPNSPYGFSVLGTEASNKSITRDDMISFWKQGYVPSNAFLAVSGDLSEDGLKELANKYFGGWTGPAFTTKAPLTPMAPVPTTYIVDKPGAPQTYLVVASLGANRNTPDYVPLEVMNTALGGLFSSRINMNLREQHGYTYGAFSSFQFRRGVGPFVAGGGIRTDVTAPAAQELLKEIRTIRESELTADELAKAKDSFSKSLVANFETVEATASTIGLQLVFGLPLEYYRDLPVEIEKVNSADTLRVAKEYLHPDSMVIVAVGDRVVIEGKLKELHVGEVKVVH